MNCRRTETSRMKRCLLPAALLLLAGCETLAPRVDGPADLQAWEARRDWLQELDRWRLEGRVAIAMQDDGWNANLDWTQAGEHLEVNFSGPLGVGSARVAGTPAQLEVHTADGEHFVTTDPEIDLYWQLGWTAPLDRMRYWVLGLPGPAGDSPALQIDAAGRLAQLTQGAWTVEYIDYLVTDSGRVLPRKIEMRREGVRIRLVVSDWVLPSKARKAAGN